MINIGWEGEWMGSSTEDKHYTVPDNGWCFLRFHNPNRSRDFTVSLYINNISTYAITRTEGSLELGNMFFPVNKGDVLRLHNDLGSNSVVFCNVTLSKFFPLNVDK